MEGVFSVEGGVFRVVSAYMPNGNPIGTEKFTYKLAWMERLQAWTEDRLKLEEPLALTGDYNVIPQPIDAKNPEDWLGDALYQPQSRAALRRLQALGMTECVRSVTDEAETYTFWDYQGGAWQKNNGIRIDHILLSPEAADRFSLVAIDKRVRAWEKPSDHVPVIVELDFETA
jgi:exodeoxyribonuclease-3